MPSVHKLTYIFNKILLHCLVGIDKALLLFTGKYKGEERPTRETDSCTDNTAK